MSGRRISCARAAPGSASSGTPTTTGSSCSSRAPRRRRTETPAGTYEAFRKELSSRSVPFSTWLPYASYFNSGIAFHEYAQVPPYPASHGCVRVPAPEAPFVYEFAAIGLLCGCSEIGEGALG
ncbi:MAG: L,D-transpeptidase [Actinobacteria bacterium]|nr:L,D-transpeptidase [Actinomycetota bacterium]